MKRGFFIFILFFLSCAGTAPKKEYAQAKMAILGAEEAGASLYAPLSYNKAQDYLKRSERAFYERLYSEARRLALLAKEKAEEAEESALQKKKTQPDATE
ncbi:MAG: DUF4398 domain-containing protein [Deltaproteobacteria bacterium]|nr:DUF4398 domain-containing protein [Deltaproteobacteria bacterium]